MVRTPLFIQADGDILVNLQSFVRHLRAENASPNTEDTYATSVRLLTKFLREQGMPQDVGHIKREHVEAFITHLLEHYKPATAANRFRGLQQFFKWLVDEGEIKQSPMERMRPPRIPEAPPPVLTDEELKKLLATCERGQGFEDRRDYALLRVLIDTGARRAEIANLRYNPNDPDENDVDLDNGVLRVLGKGRRWRAVAIGKKTIKALDRYLRVRRLHAHADAPWLWLARKGRLTDSGVGQVVRRRGEEAGLASAHPHLFRHGFADAWLRAGGTEGDLMMLTGWKSRTMLMRYGASVAADRAREAHKRLSPGDRL